MGDAVNVMFFNVNFLSNLIVQKLIPAQKIDISAVHLDFVF